MPGFVGRLARVDLSKGEVREEEIEEGIFKRFLGGRGLAAKILLEELSPDVDPLSPENKIVFATGPLTGTAYPGSGKHIVAAKSPLTLIWGESTSGGYWGPELKFAGYDVLIVEGRASSPVYIWLHDREIEVRDGAHLWGMNVVEATKRIRCETDERARVACIGQAGERLVRYACIINDMNHASGRTGLGAVMGSKNVKAIVAEGTGGIRVAHKKELFKRAKEIISLFTSQDILKSAQDLGAHVFWDMLYLKNMSSGIWTRERFNELYGVKTFLKSKKHSSTCISCPIGCKTHHQIPDGTWEGIEVKTTHFINTANMGQKLELEDHREALKLTDACNRAGVCMYTFSEMADYLTRLLNEGKITKEDLHGLDLQRNLESYLEFLDKLTKREGIGAVAADGWFALSEHLEYDARVHYKNTRGIVKGTDCIFDARFNRLDSAMLSEVVSPKGGFQAWGTIGGRLTAEDVPVVYNTSENENIGRLTAQAENVMMVLNSLGVCYVPLNTLSMFGYPLMKTLAEMYYIVTGIEVGVDELRLRGERAFNLYKMLNVREGFDRSDDRVPSVWLEPKEAVWGTVVLKTLYTKKVVDEQLMESIIDEYYRERGWDIEKGIPTPEKLRSLQLDFLL